VIIASAGATSCAPSATAPSSCQSADNGIDLTYYTAPDSTGDAFVHPVAQFEPTDLPTWVGSLTVVPDSSPAAVDGVAMACLFRKPQPETMVDQKIGAALWNPRTKNFTLLADWSMTDPLHAWVGSEGQAVTNSAQMAARRGPGTTVVTMDGGDYVVYAGKTRGVCSRGRHRRSTLSLAVPDYHSGVHTVVLRSLPSCSAKITVPPLAKGVWPMAATRVAASVAAMSSAAGYESFTPLLPGSTTSHGRVCHSRVSSSI
jgi:hypothetical protein